MIRLDAPRRPSLPLRAFSRRLAALLLAAALLLQATGCGFIDIDKRFFVVALSVDKSGNDKKPYRITIRLSIPNSKTEPGMEKSQIETIDAKEISEGLRILKSRVDKEIDLGHCKVLLLGEQLARDDISDAVEWMMRRRDIQSSAFVAVGQPDGRRILEQMPLSERYSGNTLFLTFGGDATKSSFIRPIKLFDLFRRINEHGMDPYLPIVSLTKNGYEVDRLALLDKTRIRAVLGPDETQLFNQLDQQYINSTIKTSFEDRTVMLAVMDLTVREKIRRAGAGQGTLDLSIHAGGTLEEGPNDILHRHAAVVEASFERDLAAKTEALLRKIQRSGVDPLQFGLRFRATHRSKQAFEEWQEMYPTLKFRVRTDVDIQGAGRIK
ncbi:Ger(x)C family spore germination protein [Paenibacillus sp. B01]|uniref:Ger(x)C family spore germination protein n=1 Tax=Paenibacillus sp. B01 TaxID=2660554 RepID=UPI00129B3985|nr:Ger(x)C family spore germination protein [Paenibacillus sp. B01]QGG57317.1 Ger(x)C family spore germination protein [Paenibacillus sp. B01]